MNITEKIETIENRIEKKKGQYDLDRKTTKILALLSGNVGKYELLTGKEKKWQGKSSYNLKI